MPAAFPSLFSLFLLVPLSWGTSPLPSAHSPPPYYDTITSRPSSCSPHKLTVYKVVLRTSWTRDLFPKHYPDWRPSAQWSRLIGRSHGPSYVLFRLGDVASAGVKAFAEAGRMDLLEEQGQGAAPEDEIFDSFGSTAIKTGAGRCGADFFVDGNHSRVSLMARIVPSPDWFIGIDSLDLCVNGNWIDTVTVESDPLDAGTDNGFTFTAPNWATQPQGVIYRLTSSYPPHPAGSFFYPNLKRLPPIATFQFIKVREYELSEVFHHSKDPAGYEVLRTEQLPKDLSSRNDELGADTMEVEALPQERNGFPLLPATRNGLEEGQENGTVALATVRAATPTSEMAILTKGDKSAIMNSIVEKYRQQGGGKRVRGRLHLPFPPSHDPQGNRSQAMDYQGKIAAQHGLTLHGRKAKKSFARKNRPPRDCHVLEWSPWSACSKSCGIGEMQRRRQVARHARRGGRVCPSLLETKWCGSAKPCAKSYFQW